jgi:hypothetical protein
MVRTTDKIPFGAEGRTWRGIKRRGRRILVLLGRQKIYQQGLYADYGSEWQTEAEKKVNSPNMNERTNNTRVYRYTKPLGEVREGLP